MQKITLEWLKENGACISGFNAFKDLLGDREYLTILDIQYELSCLYIGWFASITECAESLNILSKHNNWLVVGGVAYNINTPKELLIVLSKDKDKYVVRYAKETLKKLGEK